MAKNRLARLTAAALCFALSITGVSAREYLVAQKGRFEGKVDFEDFETGIAGDSKGKYTLKNSTSKLDDILSIDAMKGNMIAAIEETTDKDGNPTKALHYYVEGTSVYADTDTGLLQTRPDNTTWNTPTLGKYYVYKMKFKSGGDGHGYFKGQWTNWAGGATVDWSTGKANFGTSANQDAFALDEWVEFEFVVDRTGDNDIQYMRFNSSLGKKEFKKETTSRMEIKNSNPRWLQWIFGGSSSPVNPSLWIDDIEIYYTDYSISCPSNGATGVEPTDKITLDISGDIDEETLETISVTGGGEPAVISDIAYEDGVCTITLEEKMKEFADYTVDFSNVCSEVGLKKPMTAATFTTTGKVEFLGAVSAEKMKNNTLSAISALEPGIVQTSFTVENPTAVNVENAVLCAMLMKDGEICGVNYQTQNISGGDKAVLNSAFYVPDDTYTIEMCAKNSLNGTIYYTDIYTVSKDGTANAAAEEKDGFAKVAESTAEDGKVKFYALSFGEDGKSEEITALNTGLVESAVKSANGMLISVLKKDNAIAALAYHVRPQNGGAMHSAVYVPEGEGYTLDTFVWSDITGTASYMPKAVLSSDTEGN